MKTLTKHLLTMLLLGTLGTSCSGEALINEPDMTVDTTLTVQAIHHGSKNEAGAYPDYLQADGSKVFFNDQEIAITLTVAGLSWGHVQLISEGDDPECEPGHNIELHVEHIENILAEDLVLLDLETSSVTNRAYCRYQIELTPDNAESPGLNEVPAIEGNAVYVAGHWDDGMDSGNFGIGVPEDILATGLFKAMEYDEVVIHPFHFHGEAGGAGGAIVFGNNYDRWFDGMTFEESQEELETTLAENIKTTIHQHVLVQH